MDYYNQYRLRESGIQVKLIKKCSTSWIEISLIPLDGSQEECVELMTHQTSFRPSITSETSASFSHPKSDENLEQYIIKRNENGDQN